LICAGTNYAFDWRLITHPKDYSGEMEGKKSTTLKLSKVQSPAVALVFFFFQRSRFQRPQTVSLPVFVSPPVS